MPTKFNIIDFMPESLKTISEKYENFRAYGL
jgi:hypothetical protein